MSMGHALLTGVTGLQGSQFALDTVSNNLSNISTYGFKSSRVGFGDLLSQSLMFARGFDPAGGLGGTNPVQVGTGLKSASADLDFRQGSLQFTGRPTDLALNGDSFFILQGGTGRTYTRAGSFRFDEAGHLVSPDGKLVQGWTAKPDLTNRLAPPVLDTSNPAQIGNIQIDAGLTLPPHETTILDFVGNLDAGSTPANLGIPLTTPLANIPVTHEIRSTILDSLGNPHPLVLKLTNISGIQDTSVDPLMGLNARVQTPGNIFPNNTWRFEFEIDPSDTTAALAPDGSFVGGVSPVSTTNHGAFQMFAKTGFLSFDTTGGLQEVRFGRWYDYPVGVWPPQTVGYATTAIGGATVPYQVGPAPLGLLYQNSTQPNAPDTTQAAPRGISAGMTTDERYPSEVAAANGYHLMMDFDPVSGTDVLLGPAFVNNGSTGVAKVVDAPLKPLPLPSYTTQPTVGLPLGPSPQQPMSNFFVQPITPFFGTGGTTDPVLTRTPNLVFFGGTDTWTYQVIEGSSRDGFTQDRTGTFSTVNGATTYQASNTAHLESQDGYAESTLQSLSVDASGRIIGQFDNGVSLALAQVAVADFQNPQGLRRVGGNEFAMSANSGGPVVGEAGLSGRATVVAGVLEQSNVNATQELTNMMVAQRSYEANGRIIAVADRLLDTLANRLTA